MQHERRNHANSHTPTTIRTRDRDSEGRLAEDGWNSRDPEKVLLAYTLDLRCRNRSEFVNGRAEIIAFLTRKSSKELDYRRIKELWVFNALSTDEPEIRVAGCTSCPFTGYQPTWF